MSTKKGRFQPGGREYEKRKAANKRRGPRKPRDPDNRPTKDDDESSSSSEEEEEGVEGGENANTEKSTENKDDKDTKDKDTQNKDPKAKDKDDAKDKGDAKKDKNNDDDSEDDSEDDSDDSDDGDGDNKPQIGNSWKPKKKKVSKPKGIQALIEVENPNYVKQEHLKASEVKNVKTILSRREKEAIEKDKAKLRLGESDMARLAIVRQQREEAAKRREEEKTAKDVKGK